MAVTITGTNFATGTTVTFAGTAATSVVVVSSTTIRATTPAGIAGAATVTVTTNGQSGNLPNGFTYTVVPTVTGISPNSGSTGGGTAVTITGTNFVPGATVTFGNNAATNVAVATSTSITCNSPAGSSGAVAVTVTANGISGSLNNSFTYAGGGGGATPTLVDHIASGMDNNPATTFSFTLPDSGGAGAGNALILGVQYDSSASVSSVTDDHNNIWLAGPSITNTASGRSASLYYALNVASGTQKVSVVFSNGSGPQSGAPQGVISQFYNIATSSAFDGSSGSATSKNAGSIVTSTAGDLIYDWGVDFSDTNQKGGNFNGTSITAGSGFTLLLADLQVGSTDQYLIQSSAGSINPTFTTSGSAAWGSLAIALKSAPAGTAPGSGIRIVHIQHTLLDSTYQNRTTPIVMQFPSSGNLLVGLYNSGDVIVNKVTDNASNNWVSAASTLGYFTLTPSQILYAANANTSSTLSGITVTQNATTTTDCMFVLMDIAGADTSPFDNAQTATGDSTTNGILSTTTITPSTSNGLIINVGSIYIHTINGAVGAGQILDAVVNAEDDDSNTGTTASPLDEDNPYSHIYNTSTSPVTFGYTFNAVHPTPGVAYWGTVAAAFKAASGGSAPTNVSSGIGSPAGEAATPGASSAIDRYQVQAAANKGRTDSFSSVASAMTTPVISISPRVTPLTFTRTQQFTSAGSPHVIWSVDGVTGGSSTTGTISTTGLYTPPGTIGTHTVTVTTSDLSNSASATVYIVNYDGTFMRDVDNMRTGLESERNGLNPLERERGHLWEALLLFN